MITVTVEPLTGEHWEGVRAIYLEGIATGLATFETAVPDWDVWNQNHLSHSRLVALDDAGRIVGWAALTPVSTRPAYAGVAEHSIYVEQSSRGQGVGKMLLNALIVASERAGIWTLQSSVFKENTASLALHQRCGFRVVGVRERIGQLNGVWRDTVLVERRSAVVGR